MAQRLQLDPVAVHLTALRTFLVHYCQDLDFGSKALGALRARKWKNLIQIANEVDETLSATGTWSGQGPTEVWSPYTPSEFGRCAQFVAMVTKYPYDKEQMPGLDPDTAAVEGFLKSERRNRRINSVLRAYRVRDRARHPAQSFMREWISSVIGESPNLKSILSRCDFSNGASLGVHGKATHFGNKCAKQLTSTPTALKYFTLGVLNNEQLLSYYSTELAAQSGKSIPLGDIVCLASAGELRDYFEREVKLVQEDKLSCVPKRYDRARTVGTPPTCNTFVQKGIDLEMRAFLRDRVNLDLSFQCVNQQMAFEGQSSEYKGIPYITLDVKDASNSILIEVVRALVSEEWFSFLNETRSPGCILPDGSRHRYELFCSMGNGFCFPLETLIFSSMCVAACKLVGSPVDFRVYGDDIIVRQDVALVLCEILRAYGCRLNLSKSFIHGPFRESCGANWYEGQDVTPAYWRNAVTRRDGLHAIHNAHYKHPEVQDALRSFETEPMCCVPNDAQYSFVTDQAFRVSHDLCMATTAVWRRDTHSFRYRMVRTRVKRDESIPAEDRWVRLRHIAALRGAIFDEAFLLRRSNQYEVGAPRTSGFECAIQNRKRLKQLRALWSRDVFIADQVRENLWLRD